MKDVVKCMVENQKGEILLLKRSEHDTHSGYWETPGGGVDDIDKTFADACVREIDEEAGLQIQNEPIFIKSIVIPDDETGENFNVHLFKVTENEPTTDISNNPDHDDIQWVNIKSIVSGKIIVDSWTKRHISEVL